MKLLKKLFFVVIALAILFVAHIVISTGYFRTIENKFNGKLIKKVHIPGAEDIIVSHKDSFAIISSTARQTIPKTVEEKGGLYFLDLKTKNYSTIHLTENFKKPFAPHGISMIKKDSIYTIYAVNHTNDSHSIEVFNLIDRKLTHVKTLKDKSMISPNDIVLLDENRFYFTNDHKYTKGIKQIAEDYGGLSIANVVYFDGEKYSTVADGISHPNGINLDKKRNLVYVASSRKFLVKVYHKNKDNSLTFIEDIDCKTGIDNIEFDTDGNLYIGSHPSLLHFASYAKGKKKISPSEIIKIDYKKKGDYNIEEVYLNDGSEMSACSVASPFGDLLLVGNVMDAHFLILKRNSK